MRVANVIASELARAGIRRAFGIPGGEVLALIDALAGEGVDFTTARHETAAGLMAEGAAAYDDGTALLVVTLGPGVSNAVNAVANAKLDRVPMLVISACAEGAFTHQVFDQRALLAPLVRASFRIESGSVAQTVRRALETARSHPRGPVHLDVSTALFSAEEPAANLTTRAPAPEPEGHTVERIAALLRGARRPLLLAGLECTRRESPALRALAAALAAPTLTTYKAKGVFDEHDTLCLGAAGLSPRADAALLPLVRAADVVLLVGYDPVEMRASYVEPFAAETRVLELAACARMHQMHRSEACAVGDLKPNLELLCASLLEAPPTCFHAPWRERAITVRAALQAQHRIGFGPLAIVDTLARVVPAELPITLDTGAHRIVFSQVFRARRPGQVLQSNGLCTMGYALPAAIGLSQASRQPVLAVMGDGGFEMVLGELATLRDLRLPVVSVIFDDQSLALIDMKQRALGFARRAVWSGATDHVAVARAFGGHGARVHDAHSLELALRNALVRSDAFSVISCSFERGAYEGLI